MCMDLTWVTGFVGQQWFKSLIWGVYSYWTIWFELLGWSDLDRTWYCNNAPHQ
jgi:hypothetical protein